MTDLALLREDANASIAARVEQCAVSAICRIAAAPINGAPLVYSNTHAYYLGGNTTVEKFLNALHPAFAGTSNAFAGSIQRARGRGVFYSPFTCLFAVLLFIWLAAMLQVLIVMIPLRLVFRLLLLKFSGWISIFLVVGVSLATTVSWVASGIMSDIFTPILVSAIATMLIYWNTLNNRAVAAWWCAVSAARVMHIINLPVAMGLVIVSVFVSRPSFSREPACRVVATSFTWKRGWYARGKRCWFEAIHAHASSPALWLSRWLGMDLEGSIACTPSSNRSRREPTSGQARSVVENFIWNADGVCSAVLPQEEPQPRAKGNRMFLTAAPEHPWMQGMALVSNALAQLISFGHYGYYIQF